VGKRPVWENGCPARLRTSRLRSAVIRRITVGGSRRQSAPRRRETTRTWPAGLEAWSGDLSPTEGPASRRSVADAVVGIGHRAACRPVRACCAHAQRSVASSPVREAIRWGSGRFWEPAFPRGSGPGGSERGDPSAFAGGPQAAGGRRGPALVRTSANKSVTATGRCAALARREGSSCIGSVTSRRDTPAHGGAVLRGVSNRRTLGAIGRRTNGRRREVRVGA
jgi:hypothetical protein